MPLILNVVYVAVLLIASPWLLYAVLRHGKYRQGWRERLWGLSPELSPGVPRVWFHAVSVGEVNLVAPLLSRVASEWPGVECVISSTTKTGFELAKRKFPGKVVFYCPLDFSWAVHRAVTRICPIAIVLVELELWPNLLAESRRRGIPVVVVNGRLSDSSSAGYARLGPLVARWVQGIHCVAAQSPQCAARFVKLGIPASQVHAVGSIKFDGAEADRENSRTMELKEWLGIAPGDVVFVAGSTQAPEEEMALRTYECLANMYPALRLIIVPRHPERFNEVANLLARSHHDWVRRTHSLDSITSRHARVLLVDTVGELAAWWGLADIAFVGGSMGKRGGQNMIEPSAYGAAVCFGPNTSNFRDVVQMLLAANAAKIVNSAEALTEFVRACLDSDKYRNGLGLRARQVVASQRGATEKTIELLTSVLLARHVEFSQHVAFGIPSQWIEIDPRIPKKRRA